jgi:2-oxoglutarate ferredoxin oxidoreductase subunit beta
MATTPSTPAKQNRIGLSVIDYRGSKSTLCAGCGHNAISERIIDAFYEMGIEPEHVAKVSGIGCSSKTPAYFLSRAHSFNSVHGRMPAIATGAAVANHKMLYIGVSGDGDTASIGMGQFAHLMRRNLPMIYIIEDNGVYGLTKGQFSATADIGSRLKTGVTNELAIELGATFVGRSFSGDKKQLAALLKAAIAHNGTVLLDVISPCVTFNDHEGSTKSYKFMKDHEEPLQDINFVPAFEEIDVEYEPGSGIDISLHDGSKMHLTKLEEDFNPTNRIEALKRLAEARENDEVLTGLFYLNAGQPSFTDRLNLVDRPLGTLPQDVTRPAKSVLDAIMEEYR